MMIILMIVDDEFIHVKRRW